MKIIFLLVPALLACVLLPAQKKYFTKGEIVTNAGDTISGFIERLRDRDLGDGIYFKKTMKSDDQQWLTPDSLSGFVFPDENRVYEPIAYTDTIKGTVFHQKIFANVLLRGYCSLYIVYPKQEDMHIVSETDYNHIFLVKKSGIVTVLAEYESVTNSIYNVDKQYVDVLARIFNDCSTIGSADIAQTGFDSKSMIKLFTKYNRCHDPEIVLTTYKTKEKLKFTATVYGGYSIVAGKNVQSFGGPGIGIFFSIIHPRINEGLALSIGFNYSNFKYSYYDDVDSMTENNSVNEIGLPINITYYFSNNTVAPFFVMGIEPALVTENYLDKNGPETDKEFAIFGSFGPGVNISHVYLSALLNLAGIVSFETAAYFSFRIGYRF